MHTSEALRDLKHRREVLAVITVETTHPRGWLGRHGERRLGHGCADGCSPGTVEARPDEPCCAEVVFIVGAVFTVFCINTSEAAVQRRESTSLRGCRDVTVVVCSTDSVLSLRASV